MLQAQTKLAELGQEQNVKITGLENIPHIVQGRPLFDLAGVNQQVVKGFGQNSDDLFMGNGLHNIALFPDGTVEGLKTVSAQYKVLQHDEAILKMMQELPEKFDLQSLDIGISPNGGKCFAKFTSGHSIEVKEGDQINYQILMENSADTSKRFSITGGAWRLICSNGLKVPDNRIEQIGEKKLHKGTLSLCGEIENFLGTLEDSIAAMGYWKDYAKKTLSAPQLEEVFAALEVGPRVQEEILELGLRGDNTSVQNELQNKRLTVWNLYNAFTQRITDSEALESVKIEKGEKVAKYFDTLVN